MTDLNASDFQTFPPQSCPTCQPATVNQSTAAVLDQSTAAVLDGMETLINMPRLARHDGDGHYPLGGSDSAAHAAEGISFRRTASLSDILRAIYYGVQNHANVINMSFDTKTISWSCKKRSIMLTSRASFARRRRGTTEYRDRVSCRVAKTMLPLVMAGLLYSVVPADAAQ